VASDRKAVFVNIAKQVVIRGKNHVGHERKAFIY
jgi:hypothetical protein